jgi:hypothetical protein
MALAPPAEVPRLSAVLRARLASGASASSSASSVVSEPFDVDAAFVERAATLAALRRATGGASAASLALARRLFGAASWAAAPRPGRDAHAALARATSALLGGAAPPDEVAEAAAAAFDALAVVAAAHGDATKGSGALDADARRAATAAAAASRSALRTALGALCEEHVGAVEAAASALRAAALKDGAKAEALLPKERAVAPPRQREFGAELAFAPPRSDARLQRQVSPSRSARRHLSFR